MYDFDMNIGDSFVGHCLVVDSEIRNLSNISTAYIYGENRLLYSIEEEAFYQLEGIGNFFPVGGAAYFSLFTEIFIPFGCPCISLECYRSGEDGESCFDGLGLTEPEFRRIRIYPNPTDDVLSVQAPAEIKIQSVQVYDISGKKIREEHRDFQNIATGSLEKGFYMLKILTDKGSVYRKIVKR